MQCRFIWFNVPQILFEGKNTKLVYIYPVSMSFSVLDIALFIYYTSVLNGTDARTEVK